MVGKKKRGHPDVEELLARPWCYYCERDFDDLKILISHQKAKHFKCERCGRRLNTAGGLSVHMNQVHKETLTSVDNSLPNRQGLEVEIFGMEGIPDDVAQAHNQRIIAGFYQAEAERRAATGNAGPGGQAGGQPKKPKFEAPSDLKARLAAHKARKAEQAAGGDSGDNTPGVQNSPLGQSPASFSASPFPAPQSGYSAPPSAGGYGFQPEQYPPTPSTYQQPYQQPPFSGPPGSSFPPPYAGAQSFPPGNGFQQSFSPGPPGQFGAGSPPGSFNGYQNGPTHTPPHGGLPNRPQGLPPPPGLPQRPSFGAPIVPPHQMQQMHQGPPQGGWQGNGWKGQDQNTAMSSAYPSHSQGYGAYSTNASSVDDLISGAARAADDIDEIIRMAEAGIKPPKKGEQNATPVQAQSSAALAPPPGLQIKDEVKTEEGVKTAIPETSEIPEQAEKKVKKEKAIRMIYSDNDLSPEERMAKMPRYAFLPDGKTETAIVDTSMPGVAETVGA